MASKRNITRRGAFKSREAETLRKLLREVRAETAKLLARNQARTLTRRGSDKRRQAETNLRTLLRREHDELGKLLKLNREGTITRVELHTGLEDLETGLQELEARIKRMVNHVFYML
jgi:hypothetical protein